MAVRAKLDCEDEVLGKRKRDDDGSRGSVEVKGQF